MCHPTLLFRLHLLNFQTVCHPTLLFVHPLLFRSSAQWYLLYRINKCLSSIGLPCDYDTQTYHVYYISRPDSLLACCVNNVSLWGAVCQVAGRLSSCMCLGVESGWVRLSRKLWSSCGPTGRIASTLCVMCPRPHAAVPSDSLSY